MKKNLKIFLKINALILLLSCPIVVQAGGWIERSDTLCTSYTGNGDDLYIFELNNDDWKNEWMGEESQGGTNVTTNELQDAIHHWLEDISVRGHTMSTEDLQEIIAVWLSPEAILEEIEGLIAIRVSGGIWDNWDADMENDGPVIDIRYLDAVGNIIYNDSIEKMPISAEVKIYAGENSISPRTKLVFSASFTEDQIILTYCGPEIRIPKEEISVNPSIDYQYGDVEVTIYTPKQGSFADKSEFIKLYEDDTPTPKPAPLPTPPPTPISDQTIKGLTAIRVSGGVWDNWDADIEHDGPVIDIRYLDAVGNIIYNDSIEKMPISAEVNIYAGETSISPRTKLVFSAGFTEDQIILTYCGPEIRIPKEEISVNPSIDYQYGDVEVTIYTPKQESFADKSEFIKLYEDG